MQCKVLVVDDELAVRRIFSETLGREGYETITVADGSEALPLLELEKFDLIFLDLKMPKLNGVETLKRIRERDVETPIYIVSAFYQDYMAALKEVSDEGIDFEVIDKPVGRNQLLSVVRNVLSEPWTC